ncbi:hypothetical protein BJ875DRAFT_438976 [Amylocarpus encephaloides]|uniref:Uncharacterized protein n=1 Tax=Amylocarpus encephaloides TaxID=45428 RepID=A0A9P7YN90_9HELO|nr:hypothetical protein BJ875DRAFT_438976 [Amylocarpus encephaloides]
MPNADNPFSHRRIMIQYNGRLAPNDESFGPTCGIIPDGTLHFCPFHGKVEHGFWNQGVWYERPVNYDGQQGRYPLETTVTSCGPCSHPECPSRPRILTQRGPIVIQIIQYHSQTQPPNPQQQQVQQHPQNSPQSAALQRQPQDAIVQMPLNNPLRMQYHPHSQPSNPQQQQVQQHPQNGHFAQPPALQRQPQDAIVQIPPNDPRRMPYHPQTQPSNPQQQQVQQHPQNGSLAQPPSLQRQSIPEMAWNTVPGLQPNYPQALPSQNLPPQLPPASHLNQIQYPQQPARDSLGKIENIKSVRDELALPPGERLPPSAYNTIKKAFPPVFDKTVHQWIAAARAERQRTPMVGTPKIETPEPGIKREEVNQETTEEAVKQEETKQEEILHSAIIKRDSPQLRMPKLEIKSEYTPQPAIIKPDSPQLKISEQEIKREETQQPTSTPTTSTRGSDVTVKNTRERPLPLTHELGASSPGTSQPSTPQPVTPPTEATDSEATSPMPIDSEGTEVAATELDSKATSSPPSHTLPLRCRPTLHHAAERRLGCEHARLYPAWCQGVLRLCRGEGAGSGWW